MDLTTFIDELRLAEMYDGAILRSDLDLQGWGSTHPVFEHVVSEYRPTSIVEVGSWKGASASHMAGLLRQYDLAGKIVCVDTWMGDANTWPTKEAREQFFPRGGSLPILQRFMSNMITQDLHKTVFPLVATSHYGGRAMVRLGLQVDAVYLDASHEEEDLYADLKIYWDIVRPGGVLFGDDYAEGWPGVIKAANRFAADVGKAIYHFAEGKFLLRK